MVAPQAEAVLARPRFPDVLHKVTARRHLWVLGVQSNGLEHCEPIGCGFILGPALCCALVGGRDGFQISSLEGRSLPD